MLFLVAHDEASVANKGPKIYFWRLFYIHNFGVMIEPFSLVWTGE